jgi:hypothetical protein
MAYQPVANDHVHQPIQLDNIDPNTRHSSGTSEHAQDNDSELGQDDKKSEPALSPGRKWPVEPQQVVVLTPSRVGMMVFDTILASTPIMFIGEFVFKPSVLMLRTPCQPEHLQGYLLSKTKIH